VATTTLMSFAEFERLDGGADQMELLNGELIRVPPAFRSHMEICRRLFLLLNHWVEQYRQTERTRRIGTVFFEMGYLLSTEPASWLQPDVSLTHPNQEGERYCLGAPLIVFEIVSDSDSALHMDEKVSEYLTHGAREVWLIYPKKRHAWVYAPNGAARQETRSVHSELLPGLDIPLGKIL
jgi:Uma2 family endonuclease